ncbi:MAG: bifunctional hydroxymethylpyrimidine kinase/phosphomethylpyrimidine kinase [Proteobacteria bacterium]|nr:bifunctional hydroxymethylpyrimidine kinase/phosphomethylpyrimidine kinase [Pseudomonadota bacterium]
MEKKIALSIAGFDPSGGAGILADVKTFHAHGVYGLGAVTAVTVQDTRKVYAIDAIEPRIVSEQISKLFDDFRIDAVKIGMLVDDKMVRALCRSMRTVDPPLVVLDPILGSTSGYPLLSEKGRSLMIEELFPFVTVLTPNLFEAEILTGESVSRRASMETAAEKILALGVSNVVIKGGHSSHDSSDFFLGNTGRRWLEAPRIEHRDTHGTGCTFSSAIAANLSLGESEPNAVIKAKTFVTAAIAGELKLGRGHGLPEHFPKGS